MGALYCLAFPNGKQYIGITAESRAKCGVANVGRVITPEEKAKQRATVFAKGGGVCFDKRRGKWLAYVKKDRKTKILGRLPTPAAAARAARDVALAALWGPRV